MMMKLPCITSSLANNALNAEADSSILIADKAEDYVEKILELLNETETYKKISENGQAFVKEAFSWERSVRKLEGLFNS